MTDRTVIALTGTDRVAFLQGLVTNDVEKADGSIIYTALLTPQGKFISDFFVLGQKDRLLIDVANVTAAELVKRLSMYRLRSDVQIVETDITVIRCENAPGAFKDPRHPEAGYRHYSNGSDDQPPKMTDWDNIRVAHLIPETGIELTPDTYILEAGFERLNGVDFKKGCYVGQEIVARMKHKTSLKKGLARVSVDGPAHSGEAITADGKPVGTLHTIARQHGIAYLRFDRATGDMQAGDAVIRRID